MGEASVTIYQDTRRKKLEGKYPVKLRVYFNYETRFYSTGVDLTEEDFKKVWQSPKPRQEFKELKEKLSAIQARAVQIKNTIKEFSFDRFEKVLLRSQYSGTDVVYLYKTIIQKLQSNDQINTASNYDLSLKSLIKYVSSKASFNGRLPLESITVQFLTGFERWMLHNGKSKTTVGIYLRPLRAIFNTAIAEDDFPKDLYPFGKRKYQIPAGQNIKKALSRSDLKKLYEYPLDPSDNMSKARDYWFFSYLINGINIKDVASLKFGNISNDTLSFIRAKTKNTKRTNSKPIIAILTPEAKEIIEKYKTTGSSENDFVFPILNHSMTEAQKAKAVQGFTRYINQHIKRLAKLAEVDEDISTYYARHSFATIAVQNGASLEFIQESFGHSNIATTQHYWAGFSDNVKKRVANQLMNFMEVENEKQQSTG